MSETKTRFTLTVWIDLPNDADGPDYSGQEILREVIKKLGHAFDVDAELMTTEVLEDA
jgi:hypothetical protein